MKATEMFRELGFNHESNLNYTIFERKAYAFTERVVFDNKFNQYYIKTYFNGDRVESKPTTLKLHKAIDTFIKEHYWK